MGHRFGTLLAEYRKRKSGLSQAKLARQMGYDPSVLARMCQGQRDLTGPSGRERVLRIIEILVKVQALATLQEANDLLAAGQMMPLYAGHPNEAALIQRLASIPTEPLGDVKPVHSRPPLSSPLTNLPTLLTTFVGRTTETAQLAAHIRAHNPRLLTLTGSGGVGKSRLAQQIAGQCQTDFEHGVWWIELTTVTDPAQVGDAVADVLGVHASGRPIVSALGDYLREKEMLLVLDNCEQWIEACAALVHHLISACPRVCLLITSREPLHLAGEAIRRVPSLTEDESTTLFVERAQAARFGDDLALPQDLIVQICARLDCIPLAIELAAARLRSYSLSYIADHLDDVFSLLTNGFRNALPRHRTLRAMIDWSYDLLTPSERNLLHTLSVFAGGWSLELLEFMGKGMANELAQLVDKSLVHTRETAHGIRYTLHETIRQYAHEKWMEQGRPDNLRHQHAQACLTFLEWAERDLLYHNQVGWTSWSESNQAPDWTEQDMIYEDQQRWVGVLEAEHDNLNAALNWCWSNPALYALGSYIASYASALWLHSHRNEGKTWLERFLPQMPSSLPLDIQSRAMRHYVYLVTPTTTPIRWMPTGPTASSLAQPASISDIMERLIGLLRLSDPDRTGLVEALGIAALHARDVPTGHALLNEALEISHRPGWEHSRFWLLHLMGLFVGPMRWRLDIPAAKAAFQEFLEATDRRHDYSARATALENLMQVAFYEVELERTTTLAHEAIHFAQMSHTEAILLSATHCLAELALMQHKYELAANHIHQSHQYNLKFGLPSTRAQTLGLRMRLALSQGDDIGVRSRIGELQRCASQEVPVYYGLETLACLECQEGHFVRATRLFGAIEAEREQHHNPWWPKDHLQLDPLIARLRDMLGEAEFATTWADGRNVIHATRRPAITLI